MSESGHVSMSDEELACEAQAGSSECFDELIGRYRNRLMLFLQQKLHHFHDAEDVLQETFCIAFSKIKDYSSEWSFATWIYTIAFRRALNFRRKKRVVTRAELDELSTHATMPDSSMELTEEAERIWTLAGMLLPPKQHTAFWLFYREELSVKEIAKVMKKSRLNVRVYLFRARSRISNWIEKAERSDENSHSDAKNPDGQD